MNKGVTLSFQSLDEGTLKVVRRANIKMDNFRDLIRRYNAEGISTYTELIVGLPGETYASFADGVDTLLRAGSHGSLAVYSCEILPNSEMGDPAYQARYGMKTTHTPVMFYHATPGEGDRYTEWYEIVTETAALSPEDWLRTQLFSWAVQAFHCLPLTQLLAIYCHAAEGIPYRAFYEGLLRFARTNPQSVIGGAYLRALESYENLRAGRPWGYYDRRFGDIIWPPEEGGFLSCVTAGDDFYVELEPFLDGLLGEMYCEVVDYQTLSVVSPHTVEGESFFLHDLPAFFSAVS